MSDLSNAVATGQCVIMGSTGTILIRYICIVLPVALRMSYNRIVLIKNISVIFPSHWIIPMGYFHAKTELPVAHCGKAALYGVSYLHCWGNGVVPYEYQSYQKKLHLKLYVCGDSVILLRYLCVKQPNKHAMQSFISSVIHRPCGNKVSDW